MTRLLNNAAYLKDLRAKAIASGKCYVCRARPAKEHCTSCQECLDRGKKRKSKFMKKGRCACGAKPRRGVTTCARCNDRKNHTSESLATSEHAIGNCKYCFAPREQLERVGCNACLLRKTTQATEDRRKREVREIDAIIQGAIDRGRQRRDQRLIDAIETGALESVA